MRIPHLVSFFLIALSFTNCTVQKRLYNKGFYVQKHKVHASLNVPTEKALTDNSNTVEVDHVTTFKDTIIDQTLVASSACDTLFLATGDAVICNIDHMENEQLYIQMCDEVVVPKMVFDKKEIIRIHYANGDEEEFRKMTKEEQQKTKEKKIEENQSDEISQPIHPLYFVSLGLVLLAILLFFIALELSIGFELFLLAMILSIGALVVSIISLAIHSKSRPRKLLGLGLSIGDVIIAAISVVVTAFATFVEMLFKL
jgi:amino acid transporter